jgi:flagellin-specific chaperone FliS
VAPALASRLRALYAHLDRVLTEANLEDNLEKLDYVLEISSRLEQTWKKAAEQCS